MPVIERPAKLQASIFPKDVNWGNTRAVARELMDALRPEIDVLPLPISVPQEAPAEVPRILMLSDDSLWQFSLSLTRIDLVCATQGNNRIPQGIADNFWQIATQKLTAFAGHHELVISRLAAISEFILRCNAEDGEPVDWVRRRLFSERLDEATFEGRYEAEFSICRQFPAQIGTVEPSINAWTRLKALHLAETNAPVLILQLDLNSAPAADVEFDAAAINALLIGLAEEHRHHAEELLGGGR